jgi:hypothetical protein
VWKDDCAMSIETPMTKELPVNPPPSSSNSFGAFGREIFNLVTERVANMTIDEGDEDIMEIAVRNGLAKKVPYDPELHGDVLEAEPGQSIWWWGGTPNNPSSP